MSSSQQASSGAVPYTQLGLTEDQVRWLRQGQQAVAEASAAPGAGPTLSNAASHASSQGLLIVESSSLTELGRYFDGVLLSIGERLAYLIEQSQIVTRNQEDRAGNHIDDADAEIQRYYNIIAQIDELELDFDLITQICGIVQGYRQRAEELERELDQTGSGSSSSRRERHGRRSHGHSGSGRRRA
ncbi:hypothetical protein BT67DRAFT_198379 [Trichocladium antarcticum]|uniref:Biogenesis of lysosome-related organelles complex 1 subunit CNL1 n=1 Tax=Trichocladium antarcticum TaxID=1450529 RepID=A0AAN6UPW6_9PEZI|nr:hypothetical protein BT67DRAFT_198379 [Trichocladium antarcticum]